MNPVVLLAGILGTILVLAFVLEWIVEDLAAAFIVAGFLLAACATSVAIALFWVWVAGGFA